MSPPDPRVLEAWAWPDDLVCHAVPDGLINPTWRLMHGTSPVGVLQRLNTAIFQPSVHEDIEAVTAHLASRGVPTPRLVRTRQGGLWHTTPEGQVWRVLTHVGDRTVVHLRDPGDAREAGALVGRFHAATSDLEWSYRHVRPGPHDTDRHLTFLRQTLRDHPDHRLHDVVARLEAQLSGHWTRLAPTLASLPDRHIHGDLKISNVRFLGTQAHALIDLDTLQKGTLGSELGDALRSWCRTGPEDSDQATFDLAIFEAAIRGYASTAVGVHDLEWESLVAQTERIATELGMRFAADALVERYFGWDPAAWPASGECQLHRARGCANLATAVRAARAEAEALVRVARRDASA